MIYNIYVWYIVRYTTEQRTQIVKCTKRSKHPTGRTPDQQKQTGE